MGHDSPQAARIYQHATSEADRAIADALNAAVKKHSKKTEKTGEEGKARKPKRDAKG